MIKMTMEILNIINAVVDYKKFICSHNMIINKDGFDWFSETEKYFNSLPLPENINHSRIVFERILKYATERQMIEQLKILNNTEINELNKYTF